MKMSKKRVMVYCMEFILYITHSSQPRRTRLIRYCTGRFLKLCSAKGVWGSVKLKWVTVEEVYWLSEICKHELNVARWHSVLFTPSLTALLRSTVYSIQKLPLSVVMSIRRTRYWQSMYQAKWSGYQSV